MNKFDRERLKANRTLIELLATLVESHPSMRFGQILSVFGFVENEKLHDDVNVWKPGPWRDEFFLEPQAVLKRVRGRIRELSKGE